ncbi:MAG: PDZ domain-containing protein [Luteolibacter sp.]
MHSRRSSHRAPIAAVTDQLGVLAAFFLVLLSLTVSAASETGIIPAHSLANLAADDFKTREDAQNEILEWARSCADDAVELLYSECLNTAEPEVRARCLAVLKELIGDRYSRDGEGFIGIRMLEEMVKIPDEKQPRAAIRVTFVTPKTPAELSGLKIDDRIVALDEMVWNELPIIEVFGDEIRKRKPGSKVKLTVWRDEQLLEIELTLMRRPLEADRQWLDGPQLDLEAAERKARENYFQKWLSERRKQAP